MIPPIGLRVKPLGVGILRLAPYRTLVPPVPERKPTTKPMIILTVSFPKVIFDSVVQTWSFPKRKAGLRP
jgi:hypothetical protein